jgi:hypothetical protein
VLNAENEKTQRIANENKNSRTTDKDGYSAREREDLLLIKVWSGEITNDAHCSEKKEFFFLHYSLRFFYIFCAGKKWLQENDQAHTIANYYNC